MNNLGILDTLLIQNLKTMNYFIKLAGTFYTKYEMDNYKHIWRIKMGRLIDANKFIKKFNYAKSKYRRREYNVCNC